MTDSSQQPQIRSRSIAEPAQYDLFFGKLQSYFMKVSNELVQSTTLSQETLSNLHRMASMCPSEILHLMIMGSWAGVITQQRHQYWQNRQSMYG